MNPTIHVKKNLIGEFGYFLRALHYLNLHFLLEPLSFPQWFLRRRHEMPISLTQAIRSPKASILYIFAFFAFIINQLKYFTEIKVVQGELESEIATFKKIVEAIPQYTDVAWELKNILIRPTIGAWAASRFDQIYVGTYPFSNEPNKILEIIIHELIHINASKKVKEEIGNQLPNLELVDELATVLFTRRIQREFFNTSVDKLQPLPVPLQNVVGLEAKLPFLEKATKRVASFASLLVYCSESLSKETF